MAVFRSDVSTLQPAERLADGRVRAKAYITRAGIFEYMDDDGRISRELRDPSDVFDPVSLASFQQVPVTNDHPPALLTAKTAKQYMVGATGETVCRVDDHVMASLMVADSSTILAMNKGKLEVSCGYTCDMDDTPGVHPVWGAYDRRQKNIRGNHVAIVDCARAGRTARIRLDGAQQVRTTRGENNMDEKQLKDQIRSLTEQLATERARADSEKERADSATVSADTAKGIQLQLEKRISELNAELQTKVSAVESENVERERARADAAEAKIQRFDATFEARVRDRSTLLRQGYVVMGPEFRMDDLSDRQIKEACVKKLDPSADVSANVSDGVITGQFLTLIKGHDRNMEAQARIGGLIEDASRQDGASTPSKPNRVEATRNQWKRALPNDIRARKES